MKLAYSMRRRQTSVRMTRWILFISFIFLFARLIFATLGAWDHHQGKMSEPAGQIMNIGDRHDN
nr:YfgG family protein [Acerihabitans arboris]